MINFIKYYTTKNQDQQQDQQLVELAGQVDQEHIFIRGKLWLVLRFYEAIIQLLNVNQ